MIWIILISIFILAFIVPYSIISIDIIETEIKNIKSKISNQNISIEMIKTNKIMQECLHEMSEARKLEMNNNIERSNAIYKLYEEKGWEMSNELHQFLNGFHKL